MRGHGATRCMRTSEAPQIPPSRACRRFCTAESRSATYVALIWYVYVFLSIRAASAAIVVTQLPTRPSWHLAGKRFRFPLIRLKCISRFAAVDLWLKNGQFSKKTRSRNSRKWQPRIFTWGHGDRPGSGTTGPGALKIGMLFVWLLAR